MVRFAYRLSKHWSYYTVFGKLAAKNRTRCTLWDLQISVLGRTLIKVLHLETVDLITIL